MTNLSYPSLNAQTVSLKLTQIIKQKIKISQGYLPFNEFMDLALYAPSLGYYSANQIKFGKEGDFTTAPLISPLFAQCLAQQCAEILPQLKNNGVIVEFGAGTGQLAVNLLEQLAHRRVLPNRYIIVEISPSLQRRQNQLLTEKLPNLCSRIEWVDQLNEPIEGIILANELIDALPFHRLRWTHLGIQEFYVTWQNDQFKWHLDTISKPALVSLAAQLPVTVNANYYDSEVNLLAITWLSQQSQNLTKGIVLLIDYGFPEQEYYHPQRDMGTLQCYYRHHVHSNPLILVGLQDITAHVDFTALARQGIASGLNLEGFTSQAAFLLNCGLLNLIPPKPQPFIFSASTIQQLISPNEMGELVKVIAFSRNLEGLTLQGFAHYDQRHRLGVNSTALQ